MTRAKEHGSKANGKGIRSVDDRRTRRRDGEVILDEYHQAKSMDLCIYHQRESAPCWGEDLHVQVNVEGERKDSMVNKNQEVNHGRVAKS